jgi:hypothetical protein
MSATELQTQGRRAYKQGDFDRALHDFTRAIGRQPTVQLYDYRAATHAQLGNLSHALQDAKSAIRTAPQDPTGYLRAGKVLMSMDKAKVALDIYGHGLRQVRPVGHGHEQLRTAHAALLQRLAPAHSVDPLTVLPRELAVAVLELLPFRQRVAVCRVSKGWRGFVRSEPGLWRHLDLSVVRTKVRSGFVSTAINTAKGKLSSATLNRLCDFDKVLAALLRHCPLESLTLMETGLQGRNLVSLLETGKTLKVLKIGEGTEVRETTLREIIAVCSPTLEHFHCAHVDVIDFSKGWSGMSLPRLKVLELTAVSMRYINGNLKNMLAATPLLNSLKLWNTNNEYRESGAKRVLVDLRDCLELHHVDLRLDIIDARYLRLPRSIRTVRFSTCHDPPTFWFFDADLMKPPLDHGDIPRFGNLSDLQELHLNLSSLCLNDVLDELIPRPYGVGPIPQAPKLRVLSLNNPDLRYYRMYNTDGKFPSDLESLSITNCLYLNDEIVADIVAKAPPALRRLDVSGSKVTGAGVKDVVKLGKVKELVLNNCYYLGRDAVEWARLQGVKVEARMDEGKGGRKVRY